MFISGINIHTLDKNRFLGNRFRILRVFNKWMEFSGFLEDHLILDWYSITPPR